MSTGSFGCVIQTALIHASVHPSSRADCPLMCFACASLPACQPASLCVLALPLYSPPSSQLLSLTRKPPQLTHRLWLLPPLWPVRLPVHRPHPPPLSRCPSRPPACTSTTCPATGAHSTSPPLSSSPLNPQPSSNLHPPPPSSSSPLTQPLNTPNEPSQPRRPYKLTGP